MSEPSDAELYRTVGDVIERIRAEDQVAMSLLIETRKNAAEGNPRARRSIRMAYAYIQKNPQVRFGGTSANVPPEAIRLWSLESVDIDKACASLTEDLPRVPFWHAVVILSHVSPALLERVKLPDGCQKLLSYARKLRDLDDPTIPLSAFCPVVGWELGEGEEELS